MCFPTKTDHRVSALSFADFSYKPPHVARTWSERDANRIFDCHESGQVYDCAGGLCDEPRKGYRAQCISRVTSPRTRSKALKTCLWLAAACFLFASSFVHITTQGYLIIGHSIWISYDEYAGQVMSTAGRMLLYYVYIAVDDDLGPSACGCGWLELLVHTHAIDCSLTVAIVLNN
eukprot:6209870-Pleurochrysis_carterae.AAC.2